MSSKKFSKIIFEIDKDIKDSKKTLNVLDNKMKLNFKTKDLKQFKKFNTIAFRHSILFECAKVVN